MIRNSLIELSCWMTKSIVNLQFLLMDRFKILLIRFLRKVRINETKEDYKEVEITHKSLIRNKFNFFRGKFQKFFLPSSIRNNLVWKCSFEILVLSKQRRKFLRIEFWQKTSNFLKTSVQRIEKDEIYV